MAQSRATPGELTPLRQMILDVLVGAGRPLGAYAIIAQLEMTTGRRVLPTSMYRSLEVLLECGLIARIESRNAFLANVNAMTTPSDIYFICDRCGEARGIEATGLATSIEREAAVLGFRIGKRVIEIQGICDRCQHARISHSKQLPNRKTFDSRI
jgi:Fur family transcriptional regulator, zinc uptake regulator